MQNNDGNKGTKSSSNDKAGSHGSDTETKRSGSHSSESGKSGSSGSQTDKKGSGTSK